MTAAEFTRFIGRQITILDTRTGYTYTAIVLDAKAPYGKLRIRIAGDTWFEPSTRELDSLGRDRSEVNSR